MPLLPHNATHSDRRLPLPRCRAWLRAAAAVMSVVAISIPTAAQAQRVQFPSSAPGSAFTPAQSTFTPAPTPSYTAPVSPYGSPVSPYGTAVPNPYGTTPATTNPFAATTPTPSLSPGWDPYAAPGASAPPPALQPYGYQPASPQLGYPFQDWTAPSTKLVQSLGMRYTWINRGGNGADNFGIEDLDFWASLAFPFFNNVNIAPIVFTPGFNFHFLQGPTAPANRDLPGTTYDAFGQLSWKPQFYERLGADLAISVGVYSDFSYTDHTSIRILGRGLGTWQINQQWQAALGVIYLDRLDVKILPAGGFIWKPHDDARFELLFPQPKLSQRITNYGNYEVWGYLGGEYGGGQWSITHADGSHDVVNYNDFRVYLGVEAIGPRLRGHAEIGYVFNREILYLNSPPKLDLGDSVMIRTGVSY
jgi:hypothetical protein